MRSIGKQHLYLLTGGIVLIGTVLLMLFNGLPDRADYTGYTDSTLGYVAPEVNHTAPPFTLVALQNQPPNLYNLQLQNQAQSLHSLQGKTVIVNFWATWCIPCQIEMRELQALYEEMDRDRLEILAVNMGEPSFIVEAWVEERGFTYPILLDADQTVTRLYHLRGQPSTFIVQPDGIISQVIYGATDAYTLRELLIDP